MIPHFQIPLDLPHAGTIAWRIETLLTTTAAPARPMSFERLKMGEESAQISLQAGENPRSALRPV